MAFLDDDALDAIGTRLFRERSSTLEAEGAKLDFQDLISTHSRVRHRMFTTMDGLPKEAYDPQPVDSEGNEVWSAGQIVSHICRSELRMIESMAELVDFKVEPDTSELEQNENLSRPEARKALSIATYVLRDALRSIPDDADLDKTMEHPRFGALGVRGWLVLACVHELGHVRQLEDLAATNAVSKTK